MRPQNRPNLWRRNYILQEDLEYFLPPHKAAKAFELLDKDQDGRVSLHDIRDAILQMYKASFFPPFCKASFSHLTKSIEPL